MRSTARGPSTAVPTGWAFGLLGTSLQYQGKPMISEGIPLGAVQVPPDGQPIVLLNDRQTIGGYPRLGALTPLALARLAQCLPGAQVRLKPVVQEVAHREQVEYLHRFIPPKSFVGTHASRHRSHTASL